MVRSIDSRTRHVAMLGVFILVCVLGTAEADFIFGEAANLGPTVNSPAIDAQPSISADGLSLFFFSERSGGYGDRDIWLARRAGIEEGWTSLENVGPPVNTPYRESAPSISADGLMLFFDSDRPGGSGGPDIWVATRETKDDPWASPVNLGPVVNSPVYDYYASVSADGLVLFFDSDRGGAGEKVWMTTRETRDSPWTEPVILGPPVSSSAGDGSARISPDGLALFFGSKRPGGYGGGWNAWVTTRAAADTDWGPPMNLGPTINSPSGAAGAISSADGSTIYFASPRGSVDLWQAPIIRLVDFNGDGQANGFEVFAMADRWGTDDSSCDIGPMPWGDGVVDVADLKVLAEFIGEEVDDPTLVGHWTLDEMEGDTAYDGLAHHDGTLIGGPVWVPDGGAIDGALEFDGTDDYVEVGKVITPADGPFSVFAYVRGDVPGGVVLSQSKAKDWLCVNPADGTLMTDLSAVGRVSPPALFSDTVIADDQWHRIGVVWDGTARALYVDDILVAEEALDKPGKLSNGLYFGCGASQSPGSFFAGLIDDVRIYNRAVKP